MLICQYLLWQAVTGTTAASKAKAAGKKATKKASPKKTPAKAAPKPVAKAARRSVQCFSYFIGQLRRLRRCFIAPQAILECSNSLDLSNDL